MNDIDEELDFAQELMISVSRRYRANYVPLRQNPNRPSLQSRYTAQIQRAIISIADRAEYDLSLLPKGTRVEDIQNDAGFEEFANTVLTEYRSNKRCVEDLLYFFGLFAKISFKCRLDGLENAAHSTVDTIAEILRILEAKYGKKIWDMLCEQAITISNFALRNIHM